MPLGTVSLAVTNASGRVQYQADRFSRHVTLHNSGSVIVFVEFGPTTVTASATTSMPIPPGGWVTLSAPDTNIAAITAAGTATLFVTPGEGM